MSSGEAQPTKELFPTSRSTVIARACAAARSSISMSRRSTTPITGAGPRAKEQQAQMGKSNEKNEGPEMEVEFAIKSTGNKETINGWNTHEEVATVTVHENGKKLEESGGFVLTSDMWIGPRVPAMRE